MHAATIVRARPRAMRRILLVALLPIAMGASTVGCAAAAQWWQNFESNPVAQIQSFESGVQVVLNDVQVAWTIIQPFLPTSSAAAVTQQYENGVYAVNGALQVLNDAVQADIAAQTPNPDFSTLMTAVTNAIQTVISIVQQYAGQSPVPVPGLDAGTPPPPAVAVAPKVPAAIPALTAATQGLASLQKQIHVPTAAAAHR